MKTVDFSRSFLTFRSDWLKKKSKTSSHEPRYTLNSALIQLECRVRILDRETGKTHNFVQGASCKTERVGVEGDIWTEPNADFAPIFSDDSFMHIKTFAHSGIRVDLYPPGTGQQPLRQTGNRAEFFDDSSIKVCEIEGEVLATPEAIVEATLAGATMVASTEISSDRYTATIEYPVKTMNANERDWVYQTDTGPHLFPDLSVEPDQLLTSMELAYSAFNCPDWTEFIVRVPTKISEELSVFHYSKSERRETKNQLVQVPG